MPFFVTFENERSVSELLFLFFSRKKKKTCDTNRIQKNVYKDIAWVYNVRYQDDRTLIGTQIAILRGEIR